MEFETELTDQELTQMLAAWTVPVPTQRLQARIFHRRQSLFPRNLALGFCVQAAALACLFLLTEPVHHAVRTVDQVILVAPYQPNTPALQKSSGGGGGGQRSPTPAAHGEAPKFAPKQFTPPAVAVANPKLAVTPTITAPAPEILAANYDDPLSKLSGASGGQGLNGFGDGKGGGIGTGHGDGIGNGEGGGSGGGIYRIGGDVSSPVLISKVEPEYSEEARRAKYSGIVQLSVVIDEHGIPTDIRVIAPLGLGLDEKAVQAVQHWRFRPGLRNGKPVKVQAAVVVTFRLL